MKRILVVDDNKDILDIVIEVLSYQKFDVQGVSLASEVIVNAEKLFPDLIILDLRLPDGHGGDVCRKIKRHPLLHSTPVIIFTAYRNPSENILDYGCDLVIDKPFDITTLTSAITDLIRSSTLEDR